MKKPGTAETIFITFLIAVLAIFSVSSLNYGPELRTMPLIFGVSGISLLLLLIFGHHVPALKRLGSGQVNATLRPPAAGRQSETDSKNTEPRWQDAARVIAYMVTLWVAVVLVGMTLSIPVFVTIFLIVEARLRPLNSVITGLVVAVFVVVSLNSMNIDIWPGIIPEIVPDYLGGGLLPLL